MKKRGIVIVLLLVLVIGFSIGYIIPIFKSMQRQKLILEDSIQSEAWQLYLQGDYSAAIEEFSRYLERNNKNFHANIGMGWIFYLNGDYRQSIGNFEKAAAINGKDPEPHNGLGWAYYGIGNYEMAITEFTKSTQLDSNNLNAYNGLARSYLKKGDTENSRKILEKALSIDPNLIFPKIGLFLISYYGNPAEASSYLSQIIPIKADDKFRVDNNYLDFIECVNMKQSQGAEEVYSCKELF